MVVSKGYHIILICSIVIFYHSLGLLQSDAIQEGGTKTASMTVGRVEHREVRGEDNGTNLPYNVDDIVGKKVCVLHVGPHKTGTSTLEKFIHGDGALEALKRDNYEFPLSRQNIPTLARCLRYDVNKEDERCKSVLNDFESFVFANNSSSNILMAHERFAGEYVNITKLVNYLAPHYKVHVVVYYRRFYDWIHSFYNQLHKRPEKQKGKVFLSFVEWLPQNMETYFHTTYSPAVYQRYKHSTGIYNISVANMHYDAANFDSTEAFLCEHLDQAPRACEVARFNKKDSVNPSASSNWMDWMLFRERFRRHNSIGLISGEDERWERIEEKFNSLNMTSIPRVCLPDDMKDKLLQLSLEAEMALTPEWWYRSEEGLEGLKFDFEEKINSQLCVIDTKAILMSPEWQIFLTELEVS